MEIIFLGSSSLVTKQKLCTSFLVKADEEIFLFEIGPGITSQLFKLDILCSQISGLFVSHAHFDHFIELPYFLFLRYTEQLVRGLSLPIIPLISPRQVFELNSYLFQNCYPKIPLQTLIEFLEPKNSGFSTFKLGKFEITAAHVKHTIPTIGCRVEVDGKVLAYSSDTILTDNLIKLSEGVDVLVYEALASSSYPHLENAAKAGFHGTAYEAGEVARKAKVKKLVLIHSDPIVKENDLIYDAKRNFAGEIYVARDLEKIEI
ncbi:MAG: MBL fold metallo-hydrolase [Candidatus Aenigmatarchaeota archaeon]